MSQRGRDTSRTPKVSTTQNEVDRALGTIFVKKEGKFLPPVEEARTQILNLIHKATLEARMDEVDKMDAQFPDLWKRKKVEYTEKDMWKIAHYVSNRPDELKSELEGLK